MNRMPSSDMNRWARSPGIALAAIPAVDLQMG